METLSQRAKSEIMDEKATTKTEVRVYPIEGTVSQTCVRGRVCGSEALHIDPLSCCKLMASWFDLAPHALVLVVVILIFLSSSLPLS